MSKTHDLLNDPIPRLVRSIALPASTGYFFNTMYNVVDTWYAGKISTAALGALGLSFPVFFIVVAVASGLSTGIAALLANAIGAGRDDDARRLATQSVTFTIFASLLVSGVGMALSFFVFHWMGAADEPARFAQNYMFFIFAGSVFFNLNHVFSAFLVARGDTKTYRNVLIVGVLLNVALDPWFIYGGFGIPAMGFTGIAFSTVLIQALACGYLIHRIHQLKGMAPWTRVSMRLTRAASGEILRQSGPAMVNMMTIGIGIMILTYFINAYGTHAVAAYGIATRIEQIILLPAIGLNMAVMAIVGQNNGAGNQQRVRETVMVALRFGLLVLIPGFLLMMIWPQRAMAFFTSDTLVIGVGANYLRLASVLIYAYVLLFTLTAALQAIKQPMYAIWIGLYRQLVAPLAIIYLLSRHTNLGLWSVWISIAITTWSAALFTAWYTRRQIGVSP